MINERLFTIAASLTKHVSPTNSPARSTTRAYILLCYRSRNAPPFVYYLFAQSTSSFNLDPRFHPRSNPHNTIEKRTPNNIDIKTGCTRSTTHFEKRLFTPQRGRYHSRTSDED